MTVRIAMWSGPRNISTALMRSWEARGDCGVTDEPLYAHYLLETKLNHPGADEVMNSQPTDWHVVCDELSGPGPEGKEIWYQKHMAHHLLSHIERDWMQDVRHCFLIRDPAAVVASYAKRRDEVSLRDLGYQDLIEIFNYVTDDLDQAPIVVDSQDLLREPAKVLHSLCRELEVEYTEKMLSWEPGLRESDGVWAKHWYNSVEKSTGFAPYEENAIDYPDRLEAVVNEAREYYEFLWEQRLSPDTNVDVSYWT